MNLRCRTTPCPTCPYRQDVPSGVWAPHEYRKLPDYDLPTGQQPPFPFHCHTSPDFLCTGWVQCHQSRDSEFDLLSLRLLDILKGIAVDVPAVTVPLFASGTEAMQHGLREIDKPGKAARAAIAKVKGMRKRRKQRKAG